jgi:uncharacterized protein YdiU (UPF0061 family)
MKLEKRFISSLKADTLTENYPRKVLDADFSYVMPKGMRQPEVIIHSQDLATDMGLSTDYCQSQDFAKVMTGNALAKGSQPFAMCYGGHQFGHWAGQLGDGRAINLGNISHNKNNFELQLKGAGPTPYSRTADGLAVLRSSVREYLCSEAMHHLGVPTTRALALTLTGEEVLRDMMYDGNASYEKGAVVCRVAPSFVRFGNFELQAANQNKTRLTELADFVIDQHFPDLTGSSTRYSDLFACIADLTCSMVIHWQRVGFVHGVMNTDNMSVLGITIDYGPYGWLDDYNPDWTPNTTDLPGKRYKFANQPIICQWNLIRLANALYYLTEDGKILEAVIHDFQHKFQQGYLDMMRQKLGLYHPENDDSVLVNDLDKALSTAGVDMTLFFRSLANFSPKRIQDFIHTLKTQALYNQQNPTDIEHLEHWFRQYAKRLEKEAWYSEHRITSMNQVNPKYILRNYMSQMAIEKANVGDYSLIHELQDIIKWPYAEQPEKEHWFTLRPVWATNKVGCSMLSCSS